jgi:hypothetical protein
MTKIEIKHSAQDRLLSYMAAAILRTDDDGDTEMAAEMLRQARRAMTLFGVTSYPGL